MNLFILIIAAVLLSSCGKKNEDTKPSKMESSTPTFQSAVTFLSKLDSPIQLSKFDEHTTITPHLIKRSGSEFVYQYRIQGCNLTLVTDELKNITRYLLPIHEGCVFSMEIRNLGFEPLNFNSSNTKVKDIIENGKDCSKIGVSYSDFCGPTCGTAYRGFIPKIELTFDLIYDPRMEEPFPACHGTQFYLADPPSTIPFRFEIDASYGQPAEEFLRSLMDEDDLAGGVPFGGSFEIDNPKETGALNSELVIKSMGNAKILTIERFLEIRQPD